MKEGFKIISTNISEQKGTIKTSVPQIILTPTGVEGDAHSGKWHRQVSLLGTESFRKFEQLAQRKVEYGEFAENITTEGFPLFEAKPFDRFISDEVILEVTQIGKKCHGDRCSIYRETGDCVMPKEGIFCRVINGGIVKQGDYFRYIPKTFNIAVITLSDRAFSGEYSDLSGPKAEEKLAAFFKSLGYNFSISRTIIPDDKKMLEDAIQKQICEGAEICITTGGTGIGKRDITPDTVKPMLDKEIPGIMEYIRLKYGSEKPLALLSRGVAGLIGNCFVYTLPGSVKAVNEYLEEILKVQEHLFYMLHGIDSH